jgi:hypothetical protein
MVKETKQVKNIQLKLPLPLHTALKIKAAEENKTLKAKILEILEQGAK